MIENEITLNCENIENFHSWFENAYILQTCTNADLVVNSPFTAIERVSFREIDQSIMKGIRITSKTMNFIPKDETGTFSTLEAFAIMFSDLQVISREDLSQFGQSLIALQLSDNKIEVLTKDLFDSIPNLKHVSFSRNPLKFIENEFATKLQTIKYLSFYSVSCSVRSLYGIENSYYLQNFDSSHSCKDTSFKTRYDQEINMINEGVSNTKQVKYLKNNLASSSILIKRRETSNSEQNVEYASSVCYIVLNQDLSCVVNIDNENVIVDYQIDPEETDASSINSIQFDGLMMYLPMNLGEKFTDLQELSVVGTGLVKIDKKVLINFDNLIKLKLINNIIDEIPIDAFENLRSIEEINLSGNKIHTIDSDSFRNLENLKKLKLAGNLLKHISPDLLEIVKETVDLRENVCIDVKYPTETKENVEQMTIDYCIAPVDFHCEFIETSTCNAQGLATRFPLTKINIPTITSSNLINEAIGDVKTLKIAQQSTNYFPANIPEIFVNLEEIIIENSGLSALLKNDFKGFEMKLKTITISNNNITRIDEHVFDELQALEHLDLSSNEIKELSNGVFASLTKLKKLKLSNNLLVRFMPDYLPKKNFIEEFYINNNQIEVFPAKSLRHLKKSKIIDLRGNVCIDVRFSNSVHELKDLLGIAGNLDFNCSDESR